MDKCIFDLRSNCRALISKNCKDCSFYKSVEQYQLDANRYAVRKEKENEAKRAT